MVAPTLAIVDDDQDFSAFLAGFAQRKGFEACQFHSVAEASPWLARHDPELTMLDMALPDGTGLDVLERLPSGRGGQIVFVSGTDNREEIRRAVSSSATEFLGKPLRTEALERLLRGARARFDQRRIARQAQADTLVGECAAMAEVREEIARVAATSLSVLVTGETGTGKELVARALHRQSGRRGRLISVNCGAVPADLLASQLFGHERGSFTGAASRHLGHFEQASGGTLFLDEIGEMPTSLQVYLLRVLETGCVVRVGGTEEIPTDVRIVAATHRHGNPVPAGVREDLYYRLARYPITLPPLRCRGDDIELLARRFIHALNREAGADKHLDPACFAQLRRHAWPGNVRELRAATEYAYLRATDAAVHVRPLAGVLRPPGVDDAGELRFRIGMTFHEVEAAMLERTLAFHGGDKTAAARSLGVSVRTIHNHLARRRPHDHG